MMPVYHLIVHLHCTSTSHVTGLLHTVLPLAGIFLPEDFVRFK